MTKHLSKSMKMALSQVTEKWQSSYNLKIRRGTLDALCKRGLIERRNLQGHLFCPSTCIEYRKVNSDVG